jgi:hypothetical protein
MTTRSWLRNRFAPRAPRRAPQSGKSGKGSKSGKGTHRLLFPVAFCSRFLRPTPFFVAAAGAPGDATG